MKYRRVGDTELEVSEVGLAVWPVSTDAWRGSDDEALALLRKAYDLGVNFFDTADVDGKGKGEELLGKAFGGNREMVVLGTKVGYDFYNDEAANGVAGSRRFDADYVRYAVDQSLARLGTNYIDILQVHDPTMDAVHDDALWQTIEALRVEGKVRYFGAALGPGLGHHDEGVGAMRKRGATTLSTVYNLLEQDPGRKFFTVALESMTGIVLRNPHANGVLDGTTTSAAVLKTGGYHTPRADAWVREAVQKRQKLEWIREGKDMTIAQAALKVYLWEETVPSVLVETQDPAQLEEFCAAPEKADYVREEIAEIAEQYRRNFDVPKA
ncbi:MAG TPA: aldo/keto reductase [Thermoplasmata archaeon]|nr:aldo/keto reductase [Thermoplasmata archaeon]